MQLSNCLFTIGTFPFCFSEHSLCSKLVSYFKMCIIVTVLAIEFGHLELFHLKLEGE